MRRKEIYSKLVEFKQNSSAWHNGPTAKAALDGLRDVLTTEEFGPLSMAHYDLRSGKGSDYFYRVIENLINIYRQDEISENQKTFL